MDPIHFAIACAMAEVTWQRIFAIFARSVDHFLVISGILGYHK
jgi:hypothetical protein